MIIPHFRTGGAQRLLGDLLPLMVRNDELDITLALYEDPGNSILFSPLRLNPLIKVKVLDIPTSRLSFFNPLSRLKAIRALRRLMSEADVCHVHLFPALYDAALAARGLPVKLMFTNHNTTNYRRRLQWLIPLERYIYSKYNVIACISPASARSLIDWLDIMPSDERIRVVPNGIVTEAFNYSLQNLYRKNSDRRPYSSNYSEIQIPESPSELFELYEAGISRDLNRRMKRAGIRSVEDVYGRDGHAILMISRFVDNKDQDSLIKALEILKNREEFKTRIPADTFVVFVGEGPLLQHCQKLAKDLGLENDIVFLGERSDIPRLIAAAAAGCQISHWEGFGLTACEILAGETPLVATDVKGLADVVRDGARLVEKEKPENIARAIADILAPDSPETINETILMQVEGVKIANRHHILTTLERYLELYRI